MDLFEANTSNASKILKESWAEFSIPQKIQIALVEKELTEAAQIIINDLQFQNNLTEAELTADQIDQIFGDVVKAMGDRAAGSLERSGVNKAVGKTVKLGGKALTLSKDAVVAVDKKLNDLGKLVQQTEPVKNLDATVSKLQSDIRKKLEQGPVGKEIMGMVDKYAQFAKDNPKTSAVVIGALTSVAAIAGGPLGGAAAGYLLRGTNGLIKGEKLSTVVGQGAKFAAIGALVGGIADAFEGNVDISPPNEVGAEQVSVEITSDDMLDKMTDDQKAVFNAAPMEEYKDAFAQSTMDRLGRDLSPEMLEKLSDNVTISGDYPTNFTANWNGSIIRGNIYVTPEELQAYKSYVNELGLTGQEAMSSPEVNQWIQQNVEGADKVYADAAADAAARAEELKVRYDAMSAEEQKAFDIKRRNIDWDYEPPSQPKYGNVSDPSVESIQRIKQLAGVQQLDEFDLKGALKKVGGAVSGAVKKGASAVNKAAQDVGATTPEKLKKAWQDAGAPTDDAGLYNFFVNTVGVPLDAVQTAYKNNKIDINTNNKSADQGQEDPKADTKATSQDTTATKKDADTATNKDADDDWKKRRPSYMPADDTDAQKQTGGQEKTGTIDIPTIAKQIMALSAADKTKIIQALTPKPAESIEKEDLVLENMEDKTTYNLSISKSKDGTTMNSNISTDKPDDLMRILSLAGMADKMSKPEIEMEPEIDHEDHVSPCGCGESPCGCGEAVEENRLSKEKYYDTDYMVNDLAGGINRPKKMYKRASPGDNPMAVSEAKNLQEEYKRYKASKNK